MGLFGDRIASPRIWGTKGEKETKKEKLVAEGGRRKERKKEGRKEKVVLKYLYVFALYSAAFPGKPGIDSGREGVGNSSIIKSRFV